MTPYFERGGVTLWHGDCREILPGLGGVFGAMVTDPPYGIHHSTNHTPECSWSNSEIVGDDSTDLRSFALTWAGATPSLQRRAIGIEIEERYCEIAARRLEREMAQGDLFRKEAPECRR